MNPLTLVGGEVNVEDKLNCALALLKRVDGIFDRMFVDLSNQKSIDNANIALANQSLKNIRLVDNSLSSKNTVANRNVQANIG